MNTKKITLPDFIIADIYKNHLVEIANTAETPNKIKASTIVDDALNITDVPKFLGENKKKVSILVSDSKAKFINDNELAFLTKILSACNLDMADIAIVNTNNTQISFEQLQQALTPTYLLLIDVKPTSIQLPFTMPDFQVQQFSSCTIICIPSLSTMLKENAESKLLKGKLWTSLKKVFNL